MGTTGRLGSMVKLEMTHIFQAHGPAAVGCGACGDPCCCEAVEMKGEYERPEPITCSMPLLSSWAV